MISNTQDSRLVFALCREFIRAADEQSQGRFLKLYPDYNPRDLTREQAISVAKELWGTRAFQDHFPERNEQNAIGSTTLRRIWEMTGKSFDDVWPLLKNEELFGIVTVLGHANHLTRHSPV